MTSVLNRQLPLNGNSIVVCALIFLSLLSCSTSKHSKKTGPGPTPKTEDKVKVYDPASGTYILVPRDAVKVDTVKWSEEPGVPIITDHETTPAHTEKKEKFDISLLIPFNANQYDSLEGKLDPKLTRFLQSYAGMKIAAAEFKDLGYPVNVHVFDSKTTVADVNEVLKESAIKMSDVIVGPYDKENLNSVAAFGLAHDKIVVSPWLPAFSIDQENPYFIQIVPGLNAHAKAIMDYIGDELSGKKIYLVARNNAGEINRLQSFKKNPSIKTEDLVIDDSSVDLQNTNLSDLLVDAGTIFILPYYSRSDEGFVNSFMRKLHADKGTKEVIVFGLPQWAGFNNLNSNYMEDLAVHISSSTFVDVNQPSYHDFRDRFYNEFHTIPDQQAYLGYDLIHWLGKTLTESGALGLTAGQKVVSNGLASGFDIKPVFKTGAQSNTEMKVPLYYENTRISILKYVNQEFTLAR